MDKLFSSLYFKLLIIFSIPAIGMIYFSSSYLYENYEEYKRALYLDKSILYTKIVTGLIKELQKERGLGIAYLSDHRFKDAFSKQLALSDRAIKKFEHFVLQHPIPALQPNIKKIIKLLGDLRYKRKALLSSNWREIYDRYSALIAKLLDTTFILNKFYTDQKFFYLINSLQQLHYITELYGRERALITYLLFNPAQKSRKDVYDELKRVDYELKERENDFFKYADSAIIVLYQKLIPKNLQEVVKNIKRGVLEGKFSLLPKREWWLLSTRYINRLYTLQSTILKKLEISKQNFYKNAVHSLIISIVLWIGFILAFVVLLRIINNLLKKLSMHIEKSEYEKIFYKTITYFSDQLLYIENINTLANTYAIYLFETNFFQKILLLDKDFHILVSEGVVKDEQNSLLTDIKEALLKVKNTKSYKIFKHAHYHNEIILIYPIQDREEVLFYVVLFLKKEHFKERVIVDVLAKMNDLFLFAYRYVGFREERENLNSHLAILNNAFETQEAITITDASGNIIKVNKAFEKITGYKQEEVVGKNPSVLKSGKHDEDFYRKMWETIKKQGYWKGEIYNKRKDGTIYPELLSISAIKDEKGNITNYIAHFFDISDLKKAQKSIEYSANHDLLTGFFNRKRFMEELEEIYHISKQKALFSALFYIDMDDFKFINDTYGHDVGDLVLKEFAKRLQVVSKEGDLLARLGGDEFALLVPMLSSKRSEGIEKATLIANKIIEVFKKPIAINDRVFDISISVGVYLFPNRERNAREIVTNADIAMYYAKKNGKNQFVFFDEKLDHASKEYLIIKSELEKALKNNELFLVYQPKVRVNTEEVVGFEALLRWDHPTKGIITPNQFLFGAKGNRLIFEIGDFVLKESCEMIKKLGYRYPISVNISAEQFNNNLFLSHTIQILQNYEKECPYLEFEIVEDALIKDFKKAVHVIEELKKRHVQFSIDDFGKGYSSLNYLEQLDVDVLKIDKSFILNIFDQRKQELVKLILQTARIFEMKCIAEGVENRRILNILKSIGVEYYQGYYFSRPLDEKGVFKLINAHSNGIATQRTDQEPA